MRRSPLFALLALATASAVVGGLVSPAVAAARSGADPRQRVTLVLAPKDRSALRALALNRGKARPAALAAALPSSRSRSAVGSIATSLGFRVEKVTALTVEVSAPARVVRAAFGSARGVNFRKPSARP